MTKVFCDICGKQKKTEIEDLKKELEKAEKYKQCDEAAEGLKAAYDSLVNAGFNEERAFTIMIAMLQNPKAAPASSAHSVYQPRGYRK